MKSRKEKGKIIKNNLATCEKLLYIEPLKVSKLSLKTYNLAMKVHEYDSIVKSAYFQGLALYFLGKIEEAYKYLLLGLQIANYHEVNQEHIVDINRALGQVLFEVEEIDKAIRHYNKGLDIAEKIDYRIGRGKINNNLGVLYGSLNENEQAIEYILKAKKDIDELNDNLLTTMEFLNIAEIYTDLEKYEDARYNLEEAFELIKANKVDNQYAIGMNCYGNLYRKEKKYEESIKSFYESIRACKEGNMELVLLESTMDLAEVYIEMKDDKNALKTLFKAVTYTEKVKKKKVEGEAYTKIAKIYKGQNNIIKAHKYFEKALEIKESVKIEVEKQKARLANKQIKISEVKKENEELQQTNSYIKEINEVCKYITSEFEIDKIIEKTYENIEKIIESKNFQLFILDKKKDELVGTELLGNKLEYKGSINKTKNLKEATRVPLRIEGKKIGEICIFESMKKEYSQYTYDSLEVLASYIAIAINNAQNIEVLKETNKKLNMASKLDPLTRVANRRYFTQYFDSHWDDYINNNEMLSVAMIDIDYFKKYNDNCGHVQGDKALIKVAQTINDTIDKDIDFLTRFGGEEFLVASKSRSKEEMTDFAEILRKEIEGVSTGCLVSGEPLRVTVSIGVASERITKDSRVEDLTNKADQALYKAKENGRNRVEVY